MSVIRQRTRKYRDKGRLRSKLAYPVPADAIDLLPDAIPTSGDVTKAGRNATHAFARSCTPLPNTIADV